jgi:hypothetical protein
MRLLETVDADEVSPVARGANRKGLVLKEDGMTEDAEIADIMAVPWEREGAMIDEIRKAGADETVVKGAVAAMRLLNGVADELPDEMREAVEKLGTELYARENPPLNTSNESAIPGSSGNLTGSGDGAPKDGSGSGASRDGSGRDGELTGTGSYAPLNKDDAPGEDCDMDDDGVKKGWVAKDDGDKKPYGDVTYADPGYQSDGKKRYPIDTEEHIRAAWSYINKPANAGKYSSSQASAIKSRIRSAMKRVGANVSKEDDALEGLLEEAGVEKTLVQRVLKSFRKSQDKRPHGAANDVPDDADDDDDDNDSDTVAKGGPVEAHEVPIQKADGTWDLTGVPEPARAVWESVLKAQTETAEKLEKAETELAETREALRTEAIIAKAEKEFAHIGARDDVVEVLKAASEKLDGEGYEKLVSLLSASEERIAKSSLMDELGRSSFEVAAAGDAWDKIEKAADDLVQKASDGLSREQAVDRILKTAEGKRWYAEYLAETGMGRVS